MLKQGLTPWKPTEVSLKSLEDQIAAVLHGVQVGTMPLMRMKMKKEEMDRGDAEVVEGLWKRLLVGCFDTDCY